MKLYSLIGIDEQIMRKTDPAVKKRQLRIYSVLAIMVYIVVLMSSLGGMFYAAIIFHNWFIAIPLGLFSGFIVLNIYRIMIATSLAPRNSALEEYHFDHSKVYQDQLYADLSTLSEEAMLERVNTNKQKLRELPFVPLANKKTSFHSFINMFIRVSIITLFALILGNGIEIFLFHNEINEVLEEIVKSTAHNEYSDWVVQELLTPKKGDQFILINANSILLALNILYEGMGIVKYAYDILIILFFLIPLAILYRSKEINYGAYVKELTIDEVSISHYHYLITNKYCQKVSNELSEEDFNQLKAPILKGEEVLNHA